MFDYWIARAGPKWTIFVLVVVPLAVVFAATVWTAYFRALPGYSREMAQTMRKGAINLTIIAAFVALFSIALPLFARP